MLSTIIIGCACNFAMQAQTFELPAGNKSDSFVGIDVNNIQPTDNGGIAVDLTVDLQKVRMKSNVETEYVPMFISGTDTLRLQSFTLTGRNRMYWGQRNDKLPAVVFYKDELLNTTASMPSNSGLIAVSPVNPDKNGKTKVWNIALEGPFQPWMNNATFSVDLVNHGCANCLKENPNGIDYYDLAQTEFIELSYFPEYVYVTPQAEAVKTRDISARAYIDFVVNRTEINPSYRRNPVELAKIRATIDSVKNDKDITITKLHISGTASPEGSYQNNVRLAKGRTESLKNYVQGLYKFAPGLITSSFEPVDWEGLSQFLQLVIDIKNEGTGYAENTQRLDSIRMDQFKAIESFLTNEGGDMNSIVETLPHVSQILSIVNGDLEPYQRNIKIKSAYPKEYAWLLANVYPALRHSDYRIEFEIKHFTEAPEIIEVMRTNPQKLSLDELFVAANSQEPGSELYDEAFQLAVTMYPQDEIANLNAATAAMVRGDLVSARRYLSKIQNPTPESEYANAMLMLLQGDEDSALAIFSSLSNSSSPEVAAKATAAKVGIEDVRARNGFHFHTLK